MAETRHAQQLSSVIMDRTPGGLTVATDRVPSVESVTLGIVVNAGSRDEPRGEAGLAHFVEHAIFKGTGRRSCVDIARSIEQHGGYLDAYTTKEQTCVYLRCLPRNLEAAFELLADMICDPSFPADEIDREKEVVLEEISAVLDTPDEMIFEEFDKRSFPRHPLGMPILGTEESVERLSEEAMRRFMRTHYVPEKMVLLATGKVGHDEIMAMADRFLGSLSATAREPRGRKPFPAERCQPFSRSVRKRISQSQLLLGTTIERHDPLFDATNVLNSMLGNGMSSLLNLELREKHGLVYSAYSALTFYEELTTLNIYAGTDGGKVERTLELIDNILDGPAFRDPDPREVETAKSKLLGSHIMGMEKMTTRMSRTATDITYFGRLLEPAEKSAAIEAVTPEAVADAAARLLHGAARSTLIYRSAR